MIKKVTITGDMVEVAAKIDGETKSVRRNVQGYNSLSPEEKRALWNDIVGLPTVEYQPNLWQRLLSRFRK